MTDNGSSGIPQILTSAQCFNCRGCCFFHKPDGDWSPRLSPDDVEVLSEAAPDGAWRHGGDRIILLPQTDASGEPVHVCSFLETGEHHCRVNASKPFECRLYPFLLSCENNGFKIYAHLSCPEVARLRAGSDGAWQAHCARIRSFFTKPDIQAFIQRNFSGFPDYSVVPHEIEEVFAFDPGGPLWDLKPRIEAALALRPRAVSAMAFVNMFAWQEFFKFDVEEFGGALCVLALQPVGAFLYWPPLGVDIAPGAVAACFERMRQLNNGGSLSRIENVAQHELGAFDEKLYRAELRGHEYIYRRADIAALRGQGHKARRHEVNAFERGQEAFFRAYGPGDLNACAALFDRWLDNRRQKHDNEIYRHMLAENRLVHRLVLAYAGRLGLVGRVVEVQGEVVAYTFGYPLNDDTFCVLFEVTDLSFKGLAAFIFSRFCFDDAVKRFEFINAMDDFEAAALTQAKMSWRPVRLEPVYTVVPRE